MTEINGLRTDRPLSIVLGPDGCTVEEHPDSATVDLGHMRKSYLVSRRVTVTLNPGWSLADPVADGQDTERYWLDDVVAEEHVHSDADLASWYAGSPEPVIRQADATSLGRTLDAAMARLLSGAAEADRQGIAAFRKRWVTGIAQPKCACADCHALLPADWTHGAYCSQCIGRCEPEYVGRHRAPETDTDPDAHDGVFQH